MTSKKKDPKDLEKRGSKRQFEITPEILQEIEILAGRCFSQQQMYEYYGIGHDTWYKRVKEHPELAEIIKRGKAKTKSFVVGKLMEQVKKGNLTAIIFWLKTQDRWSDSSILKIEDDTNKEKESPRVITGMTPIEAAKIYQSVMSGS